MGGIGSALPVIVRAVGRQREGSLLPAGPLRAAAYRKGAVDAAIDEAVPGAGRACRLQQRTSRKAIQTR